ncbi:MAG TPA: L,D-transpeptidase family protein, partial [Pyrinomonadaceae bacterium]|nr:L,D-transpeptidase family protein [Pyrinomonadaceae bacterium]
MRPSLLSILTLISSALLVLGCQVRSAERTAITSTHSETETANQPIEQRTRLSLPLRQPRILVKKGERRLLLFSDGQLIRTYRIGLGLSPEGDKVRQGDRRTPEGDFYIFTRNDKSAFYLSLGVSYPNAPHANRGLRDGLISKSQHDTIMRALKLKKTPPQNTGLGGDIYIHGHGA